MQLPPFDRSMPFYPLVMNYAVQLWAFREMIARGMALKLRRVLGPVYRVMDEDMPAMTLVASAGVEVGSFDIFSPFGDEARRIFEEGTGRRDTPDLLAFDWRQDPFGPKAVRCRALADDGLVIDADQLAGDFADGPPETAAARAFGAAGCSLIVAAYSEAEPLKVPSPLWEFFRHCRNAAAHGNRFHFAASEPRTGASWRTFTIVRQLHGTPLISLAGPDGFFEAGDPILLLWDVEQAIAAKHPKPRRT